LTPKLDVEPLLHEHLLRLGRDLLIDGAEETRVGLRAP
jgi:hypothetical protein